MEPRSMAEPFTVCDDSLDFDPNGQSATYHECSVGTVGCYSGICMLKTQKISYGCTKGKPNLDQQYPTYQNFPCQKNSDCCNLINGSTLPDIEDEYPLMRSCYQDPDSLATCTLSEDPHITVFDGGQVALLLHKRVSSAIADDDAYSAGDKWLVKTERVGIQARFQPEDQLSASKLFVRAVAVGGSFLNGSTLIVGSLQDHVMWNNKPILTEETSSFEDDGRLVKATRGKHSALVQDLSKENSGVNIELPLGVSLIVNRLPQHVNVAVKMRSHQGQEGICGNFNGIASDDSLELSSQRFEPSVPPGQSLFAGCDDFDVAVA